MEERKRTLLAIVISLIIILAVGYSFGLNFFAKTPEIQVADPNVSPGASEDPGPSSGQGGIRVEVTPETVQNVIAGMARYHSYSRQVAVRYAWEGGSGEIAAQVRVDGGWSRCDATLPGGIVERSIVGDGKLWYWYGDGERYLEAQADRRSGDLVQHIPTYEDILELDSGDILGAGYEEKEGDPSIFVEAAGALDGYVERYWVSVRSGLLSASETEKDGSVVYAMSAGDVVSPLAEAGDAFTLPDGTVLHEIDG